MTSGSPARIATERLRLDPLRVEDAPAMAVVLADRSLYDFTGGEPPTVDDLEVRYRFLVGGSSADGSEEWRNWVVRLARGGEAIGYVQATIVGEGTAADIAWVLGVASQGHGYASEAGRALVAWLLARGVRRITAHVHPAHAASEHVAAALGLTPTDRLEDAERVWLLADETPGSASIR